MTVVVELISGKPFIAARPDHLDIVFFDWDELIDLAQGDETLLMQGAIDAGRIEAAVEIRERVLARRETPCPNPPTST